MLLLNYFLNCWGIEKIKTLNLGDMMRYDEDKILTPTKKAIYIATYNAITDSINNTNVNRNSIEWENSVLSAIKIGVEKAIDDNPQIITNAIRNAINKYFKEYAIEQLKKRL